MPNKVTLADVQAIAGRAREETDPATRERAGITLLEFVIEAIATGVCTDPPLAAREALRTWRAVRQHAPP
jgi:hypothetical protein